LGALWIKTLANAPEPTIEALKSLITMDAFKMTTLVFGHKSPDTDATGSAIIWSWYLTNVKNTSAVL